MSSIDEAVRRRIDIEVTESELFRYTEAGDSSSGLHFLQT